LQAHATALAVGRVGVSWSVCMWCCMWGPVSLSAVLQGCRWSQAQ
jgi:hypothetical protein